MPIGIGDSLGNYKIIARLGNGGMGAVYLAEHPVIGKRVAVKVIHKDLSASKDVIARFFQEARAVTSIGHEHIVEAHDFGQTQDGEYFYVMEHLQGETLATVMAQQRQLDIARACHIARQIASALGAAHERGIMHRDLKPDNVMLIERRGERDFVKLLDFGLAKFFEAGDAAISALTAVGSVVGTPQYMSPEACQSQKQVDHRTDIYALGILLFQMVSGRLPFHSPDTATLLRMQVFDPAPMVRTFAPHVPPALERVIATCLSKSPNERFSSMRELSAMLAQFTNGRSPVATLPPPIRGVGNVAASEPISISASALESVHSTPGVRISSPSKPPSQVAAAAAPVSVPSRTSGTAPAATGAFVEPAAAAGRHPAVNGGQRGARRRMIAGWLTCLAFLGVAAGFWWLRAQEMARQAASLPKRPAPAIASVTLQIATEPSGLQVVGDGKPLGTTPLRITAPVGAVLELTFAGAKLPDGKPLSRSVTASADQSLHLVIAPDLGDG